MKNKGYTKQYRNDDPTTALSHPEQQGNMLLDMIDDEVEKKVKEKKINKYVEPQIDESINQITASRVRLETRRRQRRADPPEFLKKKPNVNLGLASILSKKVRG